MGAGTQGWRLGEEGASNNGFDCTKSASLPVKHKFCLAQSSMMWMEKLRYTIQSANGRKNGCLFGALPRGGWAPSHAMQHTTIQELVQHSSTQTPLALNTQQHQCGLSELHFGIRVVVKGLPSADNKMTLGDLLPPPGSSVFYGHRQGLLKHHGCLNKVPAVNRELHGVHMQFPFAKATAHMHCVPNHPITPWHTFISAHEQRQLLMALPGYVICHLWAPTSVLPVVIATRGGGRRPPPTRVHHLSPLTPLVQHTSLGPLEEK